MNLWVGEWWCEQLSLSGDMDYAWAIRRGWIVEMRGFAARGGIESSRKVCGGHHGRVTGRKFMGYLAKEMTIHE